MTRRGRDGEIEPIDDDDGVHICRDGWLGDEDRPQPCLICRPHLAGRRHLAAMPAASARPGRQR